MKNVTIFIGTVLLLGAVGFFVMSSAFNGVTGNVVNSGIGSENVQKVTLGVRDYNYYPDTIKVKKGGPVELTLDSSVAGCLRAFTIKELGVEKYSRSPEDKIIFTPDKKGSFKFACSMGMGYGTIVVE